MRKVLFGLTAAVVLAVSPAFADGDADAGKKVFNKCKACHKLEEGKNGVGPSLHGIFGRAAGAVEGYKYSEAMKASGIIWSDEEIAAYLVDPKGKVPGNKMAFAGLKKEDDVENVIAFMKANAM